MLAPRTSSFFEGLKTRCIYGAFVGFFFFLRIRLKKLWIPKPPAGLWIRVHVFDDPATAVILNADPNLDPALKNCGETLNLVEKIPYEEFAMGCKSNQVLPQF